MFYQLFHQIVGQIVHGISRCFFLTKVDIYTDAVAGAAASAAAPVLTIAFTEPNSSQIFPLTLPLNLNLIIFQT